VLIRKNASLAGSRRTPVWRFIHENALGLTTFALFLVATLGQIAFGYGAHNDELAERGQPLVSIGAYLTSGHFIEALFENWESEFLQMGLFVWLSTHLRQKGSAESKPLDEPSEGDEDPRAHRTDSAAPGPVRRGGWVLWLYERSLLAAFLALFALSFAMHAIGGRLEQNEQRLEHGLPELSVVEFLGTSEFWFQSLQNWQSEFLAVFSIVVLSIFLRQRGSPQSKPVAAPHTDTGK
jgi:hypothetical protein